jgi:hypothetical protein
VAPAVATIFGRRDGGDHLGDFFLLLWIALLAIVVAVNIY